MTGRDEPEGDGAPGWLLIHPRGTIAAVDPAAAALLRVRDSNTVLDRPWSALVHPPGAAGAAEAARVSGQAWRGMLTFESGEGGTVTLLVDVAGIETPDRVAALRLAPPPEPATSLVGVDHRRPDNLRARTDALEALYEIDDLSAAARAVLQAVGEEAPFDWAAVLRFFDDGDNRTGAEVVAVAPSSIAGVQPGRRWAPLDTTESAVHRSGEPSITSDGDRRPSDRSPLRRLAAFGLRSALHLPLFGPLDPSRPTAEPEVVGCVVLYHHEAGRYGPLEGMRAERLAARLGSRLTPGHAPREGTATAAPPVPATAAAEAEVTQDTPAATEAVPEPRAEWTDEENRFSALGEIVAGVAHELNNPLTAILGYTQLLGSLSEREREEAIRTIEEEAQRAARVVRNLLSFARQGARRAQAVNLELVLRRVVEVRRYSLEVDNIRLVTRLSPVGPVLADEQQMEEVFLALLNNGHEVLRESGGGEISVSLTQLGNRVRVSIADDGTGVPEGLRRRIFEPFFTTRADGQGMGLAAAYGIIQEHRGQIWVETAAEGGANFIVELPLAPGATAPGRPPSGGSERILVVDDEPPIRALVREVLGTAGYVVDLAANGLEALQLIEQGEYDLIVADLRMPEMGGAELYEEITRRWPELRPRVIFITGDMDGAASGRTLAQAEVRYIEKPFSTNSLLSTIRQALDEQET